MTAAGIALIIGGLAILIAARRILGPSTGRSGRGARRGARRATRRARKALQAALPASPARRAVPSTPTGYAHSDAPESAPAAVAAPGAAPALAPVAVGVADEPAGSAERAGHEAPAVPAPHRSAATADRDTSERASLGSADADADAADAAPPAGQEPVPTGRWFSGVPAADTWSDDAAAEADRQRRRAAVWSARHEAATDGPVTGGDVSDDPVARRKITGDLVGSETEPAIVAAVPDACPTPVPAAAGGGWSDMADTALLPVIEIAVERHADVPAGRSAADRPIGGGVPGEPYRQVPAAVFEAVAPAFFEQADPLAVPDFDPASTGAIRRAAMHGGVRDQSAAAPGTSEIIPRPLDPSAGDAAGPQANNVAAHVLDDVAARVSDDVVGTVPGDAASLDAEEVGVGSGPQGAGPPAWPTPAADRDAGRWTPGDPDPVVPGLQVAVRETAWWPDTTGDWKVPDPRDLDGDLPPAPISPDVAVAGGYQPAPAAEAWPGAVSSSSNAGRSALLLPGRRPGTRHAAAPTQGTPTTVADDAGGRGPALDEVGGQGPALDESRPPAGAVRSGALPAAPVPAGARGSGDHGAAGDAAAPGPSGSELPVGGRTSAAAGDGIDDRTRAVTADDAAAGEAELVGEGKSRRGRVGTARRAPRTEDQFAGEQVRRRVTHPRAEARRRVTAVTEVIPAVSDLTAMLPVVADGPGDREPGRGGAAAAPAAERAGVEEAAERAR